MRYMRHGLLAVDPGSVGAMVVSFEPQATPSNVVRVRGPLSHHQEDGWFGTSYEALLADVRAAASRPGDVWLLLDSPGGDASGLSATCRSLQDIMRAAGKKLYAYVEGSACSAAYALACTADRIYCAPDARLGSIGVIEVVPDCTARDAQEGVSFEIVTSGAYKAVGNPHSVLSDDGRAEIQRCVDEAAALLFSFVDACRAGVVSESLDARVFLGQSAVTAGLADEIAPTFDAAVLAVASNTAANAAERPVMKEGSKLRKMLLSLASEDSADGAKARELISVLDGGGTSASEPEPPTKAPAEEPAEAPAPEEVAAVTAAAAAAKEEPPKCDAAPAATSPQAIDQRARAEAQVLAAAEKIQEWERRQAAAEERRRIMATRTDLSPSVQELAATVPTQALPAFLAKIPAGAPSLLALNAPVSAVGANVPQLPGRLSSVDPKMLAAAGILDNAPRQQWSGGVFMTPAEARAARTGGSQ